MSLWTFGACVLALRAISARAMSDEECLRAAQALVPPGPHDKSPGGIMLWSPGRAATGTIYETLFNSGARAGRKMWACCGRKESFKDKKTQGLQQGECDLTRTNMYYCQQEAGPRAFFTHIKPSWLTKVKRKKHFPNASDLMGFARDSGFKLVIVNSRKNLLARDISSWKQGRHDVKGPPFRIDRKKWTELKNMLEEGHAAAKAAGLAVVETHFEDIITDACSVIHLVTCTALASGLPLALPKKCSTVSEHTGRQRAGSTLEDDIGRKSALTVRRQLVGTPDEWMLDVNRLHP